MKKIFLLSLISLFIFTSCASKRVPVSDYLRQQYALQSADLQALQVYLSAPIVLERTVDSTGSEVAAGELNVFGEKIEQIIISTKTPGVVLEATDQWAKVSFSEGTSLYFGSFGSTANDPWAGKYALYAQKWSAGVGYLEFNGQQYRAIKTSGQAVLEIRQNDLKNSVVTKTKLDGVKLETTESP